MTATFGKLEHQTLDLHKGLNVIQAPNEWGKSTWCAFIVAMLYGISTSSQRKKDFLPDKERYAPWSGRPMTGRMEICWQDKNITIERSPKGKIPFGNFRAYETETNVPVPELTGDNCGQVLLGVEREVFTRAGFLRLSDLPVVEGEALRRRLNALVTTGDESGASDLLAQKLKKLKNDCRYNRSGHIPQAEAQRDQLQGKLEQIDALKEQIQHLGQRERELTEHIGQLKNHQVALAYERSVQTQAHMERAKADLEKAAKHLQTLDEQCRQLPAAQTARQEIQRLQQLQQQMLLLQQEQSQLPPLPQKPEAPAPFAGKDPKQALQQANSDSSAYKMLCKPISPVLLILSIALAVLAVVGLAFIKWFVCLPFLGLAAILLEAYLRSKKAQARDRAAISRYYGNDEPDTWVAAAQDYADAVGRYEKELSDSESLKAVFISKKAAFEQTLQLLTGGKDLSECLTQQQQALELWEDWEDAARLHRQAQTHAQTVSALVQTAPKPEQPDELTLSQEQTEQALQQTVFEQKQLLGQLGQCQGQMEALGDRAALEQALIQVTQRLAKLEDMYAALTLAQETLEQAATELQRRFAPRISARARELFARLTDNRYDRLLLASDLSMEVAATDEDTTHGVLWRSDGTADQLYLALRLAVAEELTPHAPLVLDDAFVRFDEKRLASAMTILNDYAKTKQVILFTCQEREKKYES